MATSNRNSDTETPFLVGDAIDYKSRPADRANSGGWKSAYFIIGVEMAERFAYYGIGSNLITYLSGPLGQTTVAAAKNVNIWLGTASLLPVFGAFVADSFVGRYWTIVVASIIYVLGLALLTLSAMFSSASSSDPQKTNEITISPSLNQFQVILFFLSLYLVALGQGGHKPCVQAFGADQFDENDSQEYKMRSSFFNWWYFGLCMATTFTNFIISYIQENLNWALGFGIPCISMAIALIVFLLGTKTYRLGIKRKEENPFFRIKGFTAAITAWRTTPSPPAMVPEEKAIREKFKFLDKALFAPDRSEESTKVCIISEVEEAKAILRLVPIWSTSLVYGIFFVQSATFFTKQGATMDRFVTPSLDIPPASLQSFISLAIVVTVPIYDRIFVPTARVFTGKTAGITMLQRIGTGMLLSIVAMIIAALVEMKRLKTAEKYGLVDQPNATIPMSVWWLIPQYVVCGVSEAFTMVGLQEFFYDQVPNELKSMGLSLYLSIFGVGSFLSSFLISVIEKATGGNSHDSWFANNLNKGHLDYFYWLLAGLSTIGLIIYLQFAKSFIYNGANTI